MNNPVGKKTDRSEEIAFLVVEDVMGVQIYLADANGESGTVDGRWERNGRVGIVEVTGPPAVEEMSAFAEAERDGIRWMESGSGAVHLGTLAEHLSDELKLTWAVKNVRKLNQVEGDERHLYLIGRTILVQEYYARLSDEYETGPMERIGSLALPDGISDVWFAGRGTRGGSELSPFTQRVARYNRILGWSCHEILLDEQVLPSPKIGADPAPEGWRLPQRDRRS